MAKVRKRKIKVDDTIGSVSGLLLLPDDAKRLLVFAHGAGAGMEHRFMDAAAKGLAERSVGTLRYQFPYMEVGRRSPDVPRKLTATVRAAVHAAVEAADGLPVFAGGKSMGGRMTSTAQSEEALPGVKGLVFFGFPLHAPGRDSATRGEHLKAVKIPMLFLQGTRDKLANLEFLSPLCKSLGRKAKLHIEEGADHSFHVLKSSGRTDAEVMDSILDTFSAWK